MNKLIISLSFFGFLLILGCSDEKTNTPQDQPTVTEQPAPEQEPENQGYVSKANPIADSKYARILQTNYWVIEKYYHPDKAQKALGKGRWFKFEKDGTFVSGRWEEQTANGTWRLYTREDKQFILLDSSIDKEDAEFEIQAMTQEGDQMAWVGTPGYAAYDPVSLVISNLLTIPTKAQFGVQ